MSQDICLGTKKTVIFISGGGTGFGRACALSAAAMFINNSLLLICGRNLENLKETAAMVKEKNKEMKVEPFQLDLETVTFEEVKTILDRIMKIHSQTFECFLIIHNAGTIVDASKFSYQFFDRAAIEASTNTNFTGTIIVNNVLLDYISRINNGKEATILVVNVSSIAAIKPLTSLSLYCSVKASREMFFRCLCEEWSTNEVLKLLVINYSPGPMNTNMVSNMLQVAPDSEGMNFMRKLKGTNQLLEPQMSSDKLFLNVLTNFSSLEPVTRLDYFDL